MFPPHAASLGYLVQSTASGSGSPQVVASNLVFVVVAVLVDVVVEVAATTSSV